jgi:uncharacterized protein YjbI with pentapeptide repeats
MQMPVQAKSILSVEDWKKQHDEISKAINKVLLVLVSFCFFCSLGLGAPDRSLLASDASIKLPFADTEISFVTFLIVAPLVLIALWSYLHIFIGYWTNLAHQQPNCPDLGQSKLPLPFIFNLESKTAILLSYFLFYGLVPIMLAVFAWKALPRPIAPKLLVALTSTFIVLSLFLYIHRHPDRKHRILWLMLLCSIGLTFWAFFSGTTLVNQLRRFRQLHLWKADLQKQDLRSSNLQDADLTEANLEYARLERANLTSATLTNASLNNADIEWANLTSANLTNANLLNANLDWVNLTNANLFDANLSNAKLNPASLTKANLWGADLTNADLRGAQLNSASLPSATLTDANLENANLRDAFLPLAKLTKADLSSANLSGAILSGANLRGADITYADLSGAVLRGAGHGPFWRPLVPSDVQAADLSDADLSGAALISADLSGAVLKNTNLRGAKLGGADLSQSHLLTQEQVNSATGNEKTKLPPGIVMPDSWKKKAS